MTTKNEHVPDWRKTPTGTGNIGRAEYLLKTGLWSDVILVVEEKDYTAHKLILRTGSKVFDNLFMENESKDEFEIPDLTVEELGYMLDYLYAGWFPENFDEALDVLNPAMQYELGNLSKICTELLKEFLDETNALRIYQAALKYGDTVMAEYSLKVVCSFGYKIMKSKEFLEVSVVELGNILARDDLQVPDEAKVFDAMMNWGEAECQRQNTIFAHKYLRSMLDNIIPLIRFPHMDPTDFGLKVVPTNILLTEEVTSVLVYFGVRQSQRSSVATGVFNSKPRAAYIPRGRTFVLPRLKKAITTRVIDFNTNSRTKYTYISGILGLEHSIMLKSSQPIWIISIGMNSASVNANTKGDTSIVKAVHPIFSGFGPQEKSLSPGNPLIVKIELKDHEEKVLDITTENLGGAPISQVNHIKFTNPI